MGATVITTFESSLGSLIDIDPSGLLIFGADNQVWRSNGTEAGTFPLFPDEDSAVTIDGTTLTGINGNTFFEGNENEFGSELYITDGTPAGTRLLKDVNPEGTSDPNGFTRVGDTLFFVADDGVNGYELWKSDGTTEGTQLVIDFTEGSSHSRFDYLIEFNDNLFFIDDDQLWKSDGTAEGTQLLKEFVSGLIFNLTVAGDTLFFKHGNQIWKTHGTDEGTILVADFIGDHITAVGNLTALGNNLFFTRDDGVNGRELWKSDGTPEGTQLVKDIRPEERLNGEPVNYDSDPENLIDVNGTLFFTANDGVNGKELWKSDGTAEGTQLVKDITEGEIGTSFDSFVAVDGTLYFSANTDGDVSGNELWQSDGTTAGTVRVEPEQISLGGDEFTESFRSVNELIELNDELFFSGSTFDENEGSYVPALLTLSENDRTDDTDESTDDDDTDDTDDSTDDDDTDDDGGGSNGDTDDSTDDGDSSNTIDPEDTLDTAITRFQNTDVPGTYLFAAPSESDNIRDNFANFDEEGTAFSVATEPGDDLIPLYRFQSTQNPGTYLFAGEAERQGINENFSDSFDEEGLAFYVYGADSGIGTTFYRFQNTNLPGTYLFAGPDERENILENFPAFEEEGAAFNVLG